MKVTCHVGHELLETLDDTHGLVPHACRHTDFVKVHASKEMVQLNRVPCIAFAHIRCQSH